MKIVLKYLTICLLFLIPFACNSKKERNHEEKEGYFSVSQFLDDQWKNREGIPYTLLKVTNFNGIIDSSFVGLDSITWKEIRKYFDAADISNPELVGKYHFSHYDEDVLNLAMFSYEAASEKLWVQKTDIGYDQTNNRIKMVYIETQKKNFVSLEKQKLLYIPDETIQIQTYQKTLISKAKDLKITYYFQ